MSKRSFDALYSIIRNNVSNDLKFVLNKKNVEFYNGYILSVINQKIKKAKLKHKKLSGSIFVIYVISLISKFFKMASTGYNFKYFERSCVFILGEENLSYLLEFTKCHEDKLLLLILYIFLIISLEEHIITVYDEVYQYIFRYKICIGNIVNNIIEESTIQQYKLEIKKILKFIPN